MDNLEPITTENLARLKKTYRDIGDFYLTQVVSDGPISKRYQELSTLYIKASCNLHRLFEDGSFRGENSFHVTVHDLEIAYYTILNLERPESMLMDIHETINMIDKVSVKN